MVARPDAQGRRRYVCAKGPGQPGCGRLSALAEPLGGVDRRGGAVSARHPRAGRSALADARAQQAELAGLHDQIADDQAMLDELAADYAEPADRPLRVDGSPGTDPGPDRPGPPPPLPALTDDTDRRVRRAGRSAAGGVDGSGAVPSAGDRAGRRRPCDRPPGQARATGSTRTGSSRSGASERAGRTGQAASWRCGLGRRRTGRERHDRRAAPSPEATKGQGAHPGEAPNIRRRVDSERVTVRAGRVDGPAGR